MKRKRYYRIIGKDLYIPVSYYTQAESVKDAKNHFYLEAGYNIDYVIEVTKKELKKAE